MTGIIFYITNKCCVCNRIININIEWINSTDDYILATIEELPYKKLEHLKGTPLLCQFCIDKGKKIKSINNHQCGICNKHFKDSSNFNTAYCELCIDVYRCKDCRCYTDKEGNCLNKYHDIFAKVAQTAMLRSINSIYKPNYDPKIIKAECEEYDKKRRETGTFDPDLLFVDI